MIVPTRERVFEWLAELKAYAERDDAYIAVPRLLLANAFADLRAYIADLEGRLAPSVVVESGEVPPAPPAGQDIQ